MAEAGRTSWTIFVPWVLSLVTAGIGIWQYGETSARGNRQPFLTKQLELTFEASSAVATVATDTDPAKWEEARRTFWRLYWGPLSVVEDRAVEAAMVEAGRLVPQTPMPPDQIPVRELQGASLKLGHAVRDLILKSWNVDLPPLAGQPAP